MKFSSSRKGGLLREPRLGAGSHGRGGSLLSCQPRQQARRQCVRCSSRGRHRRREHALLDRQTGRRDICQASGAVRDAREQLLAPGRRGVSGGSVTAARGLYFCERGSHLLARSDYFGGQSREGGEARRPGGRYLQPQSRTQTLRQKGR